MRKQLNLLPNDIKAKQFNKQLITVFIAVIGLFVIFIAGMYTQIAFLNYQISVLHDENAQYNKDKERLAVLEDDILTNTAYISEHMRVLFPFYEFMTDVEKARPSTLSIISIDSTDRLASDTAITYTDDLSGKSIVIRGAGTNAGDVSSFVDRISKLTSVAELILTGIEEKSYGNIVFEVVIKVR